MELLCWAILLMVSTQRNHCDSIGGGKTSASTQHSNTSQLVVLNNVLCSVRGGKTHGWVALTWNCCAEQDFWLSQHKANKLAVEEVEKHQQVLNTASQVKLLCWTMCCVVWEVEKHMDERPLHGIVVLSNTPHGLNTKESLWQYRRWKNISKYSTQQHKSTCCAEQCAV